MKYMGSKRWMLLNGLGHTLDKASAKASRFVDLFSGSGAVAAHVATRTPIPVVAYDLQRFSVVLARAVIGRNKPIHTEKVWAKWKERASRIVESTNPPTIAAVTRKSVEECRSWCSSMGSLVVTRSYGGHYFSPTQAVWIDALRKTLPARAPNRIVALAALIQAASECAASPGHTAQPFQPTRSARGFLAEAWNRDVCLRVERAIKAISATHALKSGSASVADANEVATSIKKGDLVFIDPPYSGVHYSRFYHVLETVARGKCGPVEGTGRYPAPSERPRSSYSVKSESAMAFDALLKQVSKMGATAIVTFPDHDCSNGLSGSQATTLAKQYFTVRTKVVTSKFSTLGGNERNTGWGNGRAARQQARELILMLSPLASRHAKKSGKAAG